MQSKEQLESVASGTNSSTISKNLNQQTALEEDRLLKILCPEMMNKLEELRNESKKESDNVIQDLRNLLQSTTNRTEAVINQAKIFSEYMLNIIFSA